MIKRSEVSTNENEVRSLMCMLIEKEDEHEKLPQKVKDMIANYEPKKILEPKIKLKVQLTDETPIYQRPRRFAPVEEAAIDKQVDEVEGWCYCTWNFGFWISGGVGKEKR